MRKCIGCKFNTLRYGCQLKECCFEPDLGSNKEKED